MRKHAAQTSLARRWECEVILKPAPALPQEGTKLCCACQTQRLGRDSELRAIAAPWKNHAPGRLECRGCWRQRQRKIRDVLTKQHQAMFDVIDSCKTPADSPFSGDNAKSWLTYEAFPPRRSTHAEWGGCLVCGSTIEQRSRKPESLTDFTSEANVHLCTACAQFTRDYLPHIVGKVLPIGSTALQYIQ